jgi:intracellular sulfur oxidation DsrE/DsrF family protein
MAHVHDFVQHYRRRPAMKPALFLALFAGLLLLACYSLGPRLSMLSGGRQNGIPGLDAASAPAQGTVLDVSVHTLEELQVLLDRAEELAMRPQPQGVRAGIVLVLHGPEVEFFAISNYDRYKAIVDKAARLDAFDVVDVKICQSMMENLGVEQDDIPAFIEQVPYGPGEVERLVREGYIYF